MPDKASKQRSRRAAKATGGAAEQRRRGISLLTEWSEKNTPVELTADLSGLRVMGYLIKLQIGSDPGDFMFKTAFGIAALVPTLIYDDIRVEELLPAHPVIFLRHSETPGGRLKLEAHPAYEPSPEQIAAVVDQFNAWEREGARLMVTNGDRMRMTSCYCEISDAGAGSYLLVDRQAKSVQAVFPGESGIIEVKRSDKGSEVTLHNRHTNSFLAIREAPKSSTESAEELLARFPLTNRLLH